MPCSLAYVRREEIAIRRCPPGVRLQWILEALHHLLMDDSCTPSKSEALLVDIPFLQSFTTSCLSAKIIKSEHIANDTVHFV